MQDDAPSLRSDSVGTPPVGAWANRRERMRAYWGQTLAAELIDAARTHSEVVGAVAFGVVATAVYLFTSSRDQQNLNYFVLLADAFLHGRIWLTDNPSWLVELVPRNGHFYVVYPPVPAVLLMPFVALFGTAVHQQILSSIAGGISVGLAWLMFGRFALTGRVRVALTVVFGFGTVLWWASETGTAWVTSHSVAEMFLVGAFILALDRRWPLLAGLLLGAATLSRLPVVLSAPFIAALYADLDRTGWDVAGMWRSIVRRWPRWGAFAVGLGVGLAVYFAYNLARWGTFSDLGYTAIPGVLQDPIYAKHGIFSIDYIPRHLYAIFLRSWNFVDNAPFLQPSWWGLGLFLTTPMLAWIARARLRDPRVAFAALAVALVSVPILIHGNVGISQFGYRFSLDFQPLLFVILATVFERGMSRAAWAAAIGSVVINAYAIWAIGINFVAY